MALEAWQVHALDQLDPRVEAGLDKLVRLHRAARAGGASELEATVEMARQLAKGEDIGGLAAVAAIAVRRLARLEEKGTDH